MSIEIAVLLIVVALVAGAAVSGFISFKQALNTDRKPQKCNGFR
mgnify:CR=1 FL=1